MFLYRFLLTLIAPFALLKVLLSQPERDVLRARFCADVTPTTCTLWIHAASVGEITSAQLLIDTILKREKTAQLLVTVNTQTAKTRVESWGLKRVQVRLAPYDLRFVLKRFLQAYQPKAALFIENEIWPNRFDLLAQHNIPLFVAGARVSERSARRWRRLSSVLKPLETRVYRAITAWSAQDQASEARLTALGFPQQRRLPLCNLKQFVDLPEPKIPAELKSFKRDKTILAASTHAGEEGIILAAFEAAHKKHPEARLILAPRHPERGAEIAQMITLPFARRSAGDAPKSAPIYLADTLNEMAQWYRLSGSCFLGGSLVDKGGHTPYEPAQFNCALITGPHTYNHDTAFTALDQAQALIRVKDTETLTKAFLQQLSNPRSGTAAQKTLNSLKQDGTVLNAFWAKLAEETGIETLAP